jgi:hypothetical protein
MSNAAAADDAKAGNDYAFLFGIELSSGSCSSGTGSVRAERKCIGGRNADDDEDGSGKFHCSGCGVSLVGVRLSRKRRQ